VNAASFDCGKATTAQEKTICNTPSLSSLDEKLAKIYKEAMANALDPQALKNEQRAWLKETRSCNAVPACLERSYETRISLLLPKKSDVQHQSQPKPHKEEQFNAETERLNVEQKKLAAEQRAKLAAEQRAKQISEENERRKKWEESPEGRKALYLKIEEEKLIAKKIELERKKNFLLGLCEIPVKSKLNECSRDAIRVLNDTAAEYWVFTDSYINVVVMSTNKIPREARIEKSFSVYVKYEVNESEGEVIAKIYDDKQQCITEKLYKKTVFGISVTNLGLSGRCTEVAKLLNDRQDKKYSMKYKQHSY
jgi:uncharacterized protein